MADFADKLRELMDSAKLSGNALHKISGVPQTTVSAYLRRANKPSWEHVQKIALALGVGCADLQEDPPEAKPPKPAVFKKSKN